MSILPLVTKAEYFIDAHPAAGKGKPLAVSKTDTLISLKDSVAVSTFAAGFHTLSIRALNATGNWSLFATRTFFITGDTTDNSVL